MSDEEKKEEEQTENDDCTSLSKWNNINFKSCLFFQINKI